MLVTLPDGAEQLSDEERIGLEDLIVVLKEEGRNKTEINNSSYIYIKNCLEKQFNSTAEINDYLDNVKEDSRKFWYMFSPMVQMTLPHQDAKNTIYTRTNGISDLTWTSKNLVPFGVHARLLMFYICTYAIKAGSPIVPINTSRNGFARDLGLTPSGGLNKSIKEQINRLYPSQITMEFKENLINDRKNTDFENLGIIKRGSFWWSTDFKEVGGYFELTSDFFELLRGTKDSMGKGVPLNKNVIAQLSKSCMALDIYAFLKWRSFTLWASNRKNAVIPYDGIAAQLGSDMTNSARFKHYFLEQLKLVLAADPELKVAVLDKKFIVYKSKPLING